MRLKLVAITILVLLCTGISPVLAAGNNIERVSVSDNGTQGNGQSRYQSISYDSRYVAFMSEANNLIPSDTNGFFDIFVRDLQANTTSRVSVVSDGAQGTILGSQFASISGDGRFVSFNAQAINFIPDLHAPQVFIRDQLTNTTTIVSISDNGTPGSPGGSVFSSTSYDGRYVAFSSGASNLVPNDTNNMPDIFIRDRQANTTFRISVASDSTQGNGDCSWWPSVSGDGRYVAFDSTSNNLVPNDTNSSYDTFIRDLQANTTTRVSVASDGTQGNSGSGISPSSISADGWYVAFASLADNLVPNDTNGIADIFVRDRQANTTTLVSIASDGTQGNGESHYCSMSGDGRYVVFDSDSTNFVPNDTNSKPDVFIRDRQKNITAIVSISNDGIQGNDESWYPTISTDGKRIAFFSKASNLVQQDTNVAWDVFIADNTLYEESPTYAPPIPPTPSSPRASPSLPRQLNQAQISLQYLSVNPQQAAANQPLTITGNVVNTGDQAGNYNLALKINGKVEQTRSVSVGPQATQPVKFTVAKSEPGTYTVDIGGQTVSFTILGASRDSSSTSRGGLLAILIIGIMLLATITILLISRRTA